MLRLTLSAGRNRVPGRIFKDLLLTAQGRGGPSASVTLQWVYHTQIWAPPPGTGSSCSDRRGLVCTSGGRSVVAGSWSGVVWLLSVLISRKLSEKKLSQRREAFADPWACGFRHQGHHLSRSVALEHAAWCQSARWSLLTQAWCPETTVTVFGSPEMRLLLFPR